MDRKIIMEKVEVESTSSCKSTPNRGKKGRLSQDFSCYLGDIIPVLEETQKVFLVDEKGVYEFKDDQSSDQVFDGTPKEERSPIDPGSKNKKFLKPQFHILLIDDDEINNYFVIQRIRERERSTAFSIAENGNEALDILSMAKNNGGKFPDLILLDIDMPGMDGFEFLEIYQKEYADLKEGTKLWVVTSSTLKSDKMRALAYDSVDKYVYKPLPISLFG